MLKYFCAFSLFLMAFAACRHSSSDSLFSAVSSRKSGIAFRNPIVEDETFNVLQYSYLYNGGGLAVGDVNNDGLPDIYFTANMSPNRLYINKGNFEFEDQTQKAGVEARNAWNTGAAMADVNGDGWLDIYVCRSADVDPLRRRNLLFINNKNGTFSEQAEKYGLADAGYSTQAAFFDYDRDGDLDVFLLNHSVQQYAGFDQYLTSYKKRSNPFYGDKLYRNEGNKFVDVSASAGIIQNVLGFGLGIAIADINGDDWPDMYVSNDFHEQDYLYINQGNGTFKESLTEYLDHVSLFSMGSDIADINNDGKPEIMTLDMLPEGNYRQKMTSGPDHYEKNQVLIRSGFYYQTMRNMLHLNNGGGSFSEIGQLAGVSNTDWSWSALFADFDNDGWKDLFITNGYKRDYTNMDFLAYTADQKIQASTSKNKIEITSVLEKMPPVEVHNYIYKNNDGFTFSNKIKEWGFEEPVLSNGAAYADLDLDGDLDLVVNNINTAAGLYRNNSREKNKQHYLRIRLKGPNGNTFGVGAKLIISLGNLKQVQILQPCRGFQSSVEPIAHFGLGQAAKVDKLEIIWPDGKYQSLSSLTADQTIEVDYKPTAPSPPTAVLPAPLLSEIPAPAFLHQENFFIDFKREPLLPNMLSTQGPRLAAADVNGDGRDDFFVGGARGQAGVLFIQNAAGNFLAQANPVFEADKAAEDTGTAFFDADGDGDQDLYVASGGNEVEEGAPELQDRLYFNDGKGNFQKQADALPTMRSNTQALAPADMDADGDVDVFVGGRGLPGRYPTPSRSYLLRNDGHGHFADATAELAPQLQNPGMVCAALWLDYNKDQKQDLVLAGEWMPLRFFANTGKKLEEKTSSTGLKNTEGWWSSLAASDMDKDGDLDLIAGNFGWNTQFKASAAEPVSLVYKDFDLNGSLDPVMFYYLDGKNYPMPSRDDLLSQLVFLKKKFVHYDTYANAGLEDIFTAQQLQGAQWLYAKNMSSAYLENLGNGQFEWHTLPIEAQFAPVFAIAPADYNGDGHQDLLLAGNLTETRVKFGRYDASKGLLLLGDGKGDFRSAPPSQSGLHLRGSVRDLRPLKLANGRQVVAVARNNAPLLLLGLSKEPEKINH